MGNAKATKRRQNQADSNVTSRYRYRDFWGPRYWKSWLSIVGLYCLAWTPMWLRGVLVALLTQVLLVAVPSRRRVVSTNLRLCFPELSPKKHSSLMRQTYRSNLLNFFDTAHAWCRSVSAFSLSIEGWHHLEAAQKSQRGVIVMSGHFGPIDILGALLKDRVRFSVMYRKHNNELFNYFMTRSRERYSEQTIARKDIRALMKALKSRQFVWYAPDQDYGRKGSVFVPFFGISTATITMTSKLAQATNAVVLPVSAYRLPGGRRFVMRVDPPMQIPSGDDYQDALQINRWLEQKIRAHPDQYLWLHRRFKTRPPGEPSLYL